MNNQTATQLEKARLVTVVQHPILLLMLHISNSPIVQKKSFPYIVPESGRWGTFIFLSYMQCV